MHIAHHCLCTAYLVTYLLCWPCLSLQACQDGGGTNVFGIGSVKSAQFRDVSTSDWTFKMSYSNSAQKKLAEVSYTLAATNGTQFTFISENPADTYVSWCSFFNLHTCRYRQTYYCFICYVYINHGYMVFSMYVYTTRESKPEEVCSAYAFGLGHMHCKFLMTEV